MQKINARYPSLSTAEINNIESVTTYSYNGHTYTHITFYTHNNQLQSMVIDSYYTTAGNILETTYRCDSNFCTCQIVIEQSEKGEVTIRCSCPPCTMTIQ
ncbi:hypothetical protein [Phnomibacter ginsenosidimutans]|uniref:Uncharacterized protein n=1 Tax=Phnomibacter ginsenosidimutans TaxID=2676868 RepID=A0A6I6G9Q7_9BACT|nr:hypothetical protein [Phnomibacter ginsenosidimutans]QGW28293.1 hypothetical protein GLV81_09460 [Phnomibacter ginsenosidimutans]